MAKKPYITISASAYDQFKADLEDADLDAEELYVKYRDDVDLLNWNIEITYHKGQ